MHIQQFHCSWSNHECDLIRQYRKHKPVPENTKISRTLWVKLQKNQSQVEYRGVGLIGSAEGTLAKRMIPVSNGAGKAANVSAVAMKIAGSSDDVFEYILPGKYKHKPEIPTY